MVSIKIIRFLNSFNIYKPGDSYDNLISKIKKKILEIENKDRRTQLESEFILLDFSELNFLKNKQATELKEFLDYKNIIKNTQHPSKQCKIDLYISGIYKKGLSFKDIYYNNDIKNLKSCSTYNFKILRDFDEKELKEILDLNLIDKIFANNSFNTNTVYNKKLSILCLYLIKYFDLYNNNDSIDTFSKKIKDFKNKNLFFKDKKQELIKKAKVISCLEELDYSKLKNMSQEELDKLLSFDKNFSSMSKKIIINSITSLLSGAILYKKFNSYKNNNKEKNDSKKTIKNKKTNKKINNKKINNKKNDKI